MNRSDCKAHAKQSYFFVFRWITLKFGVGVIFGSLSQILAQKLDVRTNFWKNRHFFSLRSCFLAKYTLINWLP